MATALIRKGAYPVKRIAGRLQMRDPPMVIKGLRPLSTGFLRKRKNLRLTIREYTVS